ncbi:MAG: hypothetical protein WAW06_01100 [bacterium]
MTAKLAKYFSELSRSFGLLLIGAAIVTPAANVITGRAGTASVADLLAMGLVLIVGLLHIILGAILSIWT